jgi:uroporphyrin-III C-methyltransferase
MPPALLTAIDSTNHVHLIIGCNSLAGARCSKSLEVGAIPKLIAPETAVLHYGVGKRIASEQVEWIKSRFEDIHLTTLGRPEVDGVVDAVFVTFSTHDPLSKTA